MYKAVSSFLDHTEMFSGKQCADKHKNSFSIVKQEAQRATVAHLRVKKNIVTGQKKSSCVFTIHGHGGHLAHVT